MSRAVTILYGTETFTAEGYAERTGEELEEEGYDVTVTDMEDFDPEEITALRTLLVITSTYGNGDPPANAEHLYEHLMADSAPVTASALFGLRPRRHHLPPVRAVRKGLRPAPRRPRRHPVHAPAGLRRRHRPAVGRMAGQRQDGARGPVLGRGAR